MKGIELSEYHGGMFVPLTYKFICWSFNVMVFVGGKFGE